MNLTENKAEVLNMKPHLYRNHHLGGWDCQIGNHRFNGDWETVSGVAKAYIKELMSGLRFETIH